jgi:L-fuculose-phosphate aldolase
MYGIAKTEDEHRQQMTELGKSLHQQGFVAATDGNLSVRLNGARVMTTPTNMSKGMCCPEDMIIVDMDGNKISGTRNASTELAMHLLVYKLRPDINGIVHAHPPTATGFAAAGLSLNKALISEVVLSLGSVPLARYGTPGTPELADALRDLVPHYDAILMANHGVVTFGEDLLKAFFNMETVEHFAKIALVTETLGKQVLLSKHDVEKLFEARSRYFGTPPGAAQMGERPVASDDPVLARRLSLIQDEFKKFLEEAIRKLRVWPVS